MSVLKAAFVGLILLVTLTNCETFRFGKAFGDHMVLQRAPEASTVWGFSTTFGQTIQLAIASSSWSYNATVSSHVSYLNSNNSVWKFSLPPRPAGGPYKVSVSDGASTITLNDVYFGDVFVCSGQSNMQMTVALAFNASAEIAASKNYPLIRLFTASEVYHVGTPLEDFADNGIDLPWSVAGPDTITTNPATWNHFSASCWFYGKNIYDLHAAKGEVVPLGLMVSCWGGTTDQAWASPDALKSCGIKYPLPPNPPSGPNNNFNSLYNAMVVPLMNTTIKGYLWYQGEANVDNPDLYTCTFPAMIADYRVKWSASTATSPNFPFIFVQLAGYCTCGDGNANITCDNSQSAVTPVAKMRFAQTAYYGYAPNPKMPNSYVATAFDLADPTSPQCDIHPRSKQEVGRRAAIVAWCSVYGNSDFPCVGPSPQTFNLTVVKKGIFHTTWKLDIEFTKVAGAIQWIQGNADTAGFELQLSSGAFVPAPITAVSNNVVTVQVQTLNLRGKPMFVRYAWRDRPCAPHFDANGNNCQLYYWKSLPVYPFAAPIS